MAQGEPAKPDWRAELERMTPRLLAWAHLRLSGRTSADAEDLTQEVLCRVITKIDSVAGGSLQAFVFAVAKHVLLEHHRRRRHAARIRIAEGDSSAYGAMDDVAAAATTLTRRIAKRDDIRNLLAVLGNLDEQDRTLAVLCGMEGQTCRAAAVQLGVSESAAAKRWHRLRARLKELADFVVD
jgi:RNA polymerase sigma-70 factor (ECF subfamily)